MEKSDHMTSPVTLQGAGVCMGFRAVHWRRPACCGHTALNAWPEPQPLSPSAPGFSWRNSENAEGSGLLTCLLGKRPEHFIGFFLFKESEDQVSGVGSLEGHGSDGLAPKGFAQRVRRVQKSFLSMKGRAGQDGPQLLTQPPGGPPLPSPRDLLC